jgi:hypothetical protein
LTNLSHVYVSNLVLNMVLSCVVVAVAVHTRDMSVWATTHQLLGFFQRALCSADGGFPGLSACLFDLLYLLAEIGLHQLQLGFIAAEALGACICVDEIGHGCGVVWAAPTRVV